MAGSKPAIHCATAGHGRRAATQEISYNYRGETDVTRELVCDECAESYARRPVLAGFAAAPLPRLSHRSIGDHEYELLVQARPGARKVPIGIVGRHGRLPSMQRWYGGGNWDGARTSPSRDTRGDADAWVFGEWRRHEQRRIIEFARGLDSEQR